MPLRCIHPLLVLPSYFKFWYDEEFYDIGDRESLLGQGIFNWLVSIRQSHLVYRYLELYVPCHFARQFGYDQL